MADRDVERFQDIHMKCKCQPSLYSNRFCVVRVAGALDRSVVFVAGSIAISTINHF